MTKENKSKPKSLVKRFNKVLLVIYIISVLVTAPAMYFYTENQVVSRAQEDLVLLVDVVKSVQKYVATDLRPHFSKQNIYYSPAISGIVASARVSKYLKKEQPKYIIRNVSDNPLNLNNMATGFELDLLKEFRQSRMTDEIRRVGTINGKEYIINAAPKVTYSKGCMRCHGVPSKAPADVVNVYGTESGFGWKLNQVVGVSIVGVPLDDIQKLTFERSAYMIGALTILFALLFMIINSLVRRLILTPIVEMTDVAKAVSGGDLYRVVDETSRNDEIGELSKAFELMRRSLVTAMKRLKK